MSLVSRGSGTDERDVPVGPGRQVRINPAGAVALRAAHCDGQLCLTCEVETGRSEATACGDELPSGHLVGERALLARCLVDALQDAVTPGPSRLDAPDRARLTQHLADADFAEQMAAVRGAAAD